MKTEIIQELVDLLASCTDKATDELIFLSDDLKDQTTQLTALQIQYDEWAEGISINLANQAITIYKTKEDCIKHFQGKIEKPIVILADKIIYEKDADNVFFENLIYSLKIRTLIENKEIISFHEKITKNFILLSESNGKLQMGYESKPLEFYNEEHNLKNLFELLLKKLDKDEFASFFRDNIIKSVEDEEDIKRRYITFLTRLNNTIEKTEREYSLFINKFSFEKFNSELKKEKEKYIKNIQENLSEFLSKVNALPVQFGVYILLIFRFENEMIPLIGTVILIISWSAFSFFSLQTMKKTINFIERNFKNVFEQIAKESGMEEEVLEQDKKEVNNKINDIRKMIIWYQSVMIIFSLIFIVFSSSNIYKQYNKMNEKNIHINVVNEEIKESNNIKGSIENNQSQSNKVIIHKAANNEKEVHK